MNPSHEIGGFWIRPKPPFRLDLTVWALRRLPINQMDHWEGGTYRRVVVIDRNAVGVSVRQHGDLENPRLRVTLTGQEEDAAPLTGSASAAKARLYESVRLELSKLLGLEVNLSPFCRLASADEHAGPLVRRFAGLKPPRFPTVFEAVVNGVACQQLSLNVGIHLLNRLSFAYGRACGGAQGFPRPQDLAAVDPGHLRSLGFSMRKAANILAIAEAVTSGRLDLEDLVNVDDDVAVTRLEELKGIGRWTAQYVALRGLGRLNVFPADDVGSQNKVQHWLSLDSRPGYDRVLRLLDRFDPYRGLIYFYLLLARLADDGFLVRASMR